MKNSHFNELCRTIKCNRCIFHDDTSLNDDETRKGAMVISSDDQIVVQANLEYKKMLINLVQYPRISYAICDSGADSCVVGKIAKIESVTMRTANLVGCDPQTTKSSNLPIVTALLKAFLAESVTVLF